MALPAILTHRNGETPDVLVSAAELDATGDLASLMALVEERLAARA